MKRINEKTGSPFKRGDEREDGKYFLGYSKNLNKKTGYFYERWGCGSYLSNYGKQYYKNNRARILLVAAKFRSIKNDAECTITLDWIQSKLDAGVCELTGLPFDTDETLDTKNNPYSPSLDRIDSKNKNYTPDNVRVVLSFVNMALNDLGLDKAIPIFKALIEKYDETK